MYVHSNLFFLNSISIYIYKHLLPTAHNNIHSSGEMYVCILCPVIFEVKMLGEVQSLPSVKEMLTTAEKILGCLVGKYLIEDPVRSLVITWYNNV